MEVENREEYSIVGDKYKKHLYSLYKTFFKRFASFVEVSDLIILQSELTLDRRSGYTKQTIF